jgi:hypothetical protein
MLGAAKKKGNPALLAAKRTTAALFVRKLLPQVESLCVSVEYGAGDMMQLAAEQF